MKNQGNLFSVNLQSVESKAKRAALSLALPILRKALGLNSFEKEYKSIKAKAGSKESQPEEFAGHILQHLGTTWTINGKAPEEYSSEEIPSKGPLLFVSNHPFGGIEGVLLLHVLRKFRPELKVLTNFLLERLPELSPAFISVDPFSSGVDRKSVKGLSDSLRWLKAGNSMLVFPSGAVSHLSVKERSVSDPEWSENVARLALKTNATVVPLFIKGRNGMLFQLAGLVHPILRTMLLPRIFLKSARTIHLRIGASIGIERLKKCDSNKETIGYLRLRSYLLANDENKTKAEPTKKKAKQIVDAIPPEKLAKEIEALTEEQCLFRDSSNEVYFASAEQVPLVLQEIGRLREVTFRETGEGTGEAQDLDLYDNFYTHLFLWKPKLGAIAGAYRIGKTDEILAKHGIQGLYTYSLFHFKANLLKQIGPALEMGRSFISPRFQKEPTSLHKLWVGIGRFVAKHPEYKTLFGPVSISNDYRDLSRQLIVDFLKHNFGSAELSSKIKNRQKLQEFRIRGISKEYVHTVKDVADVNELLKEIESKHHSIPILLKHYLRLGAKTLGYNVDPNFGNVLDALIYVDLSKTARPLLGRYLGKDAVDDFIERHQSKANDTEDSSNTA